LLTCATTFVGLYIQIFLVLNLPKIPFNGFSLRVLGGNESIGGTSVLVFLLPIGIWWVQPRINRVFTSDWGNINPDTPLDHNLGQQSQN
jgi:hypothetical protein